MTSGSEKRQRTVRCSVRFTPDEYSQIAMRAERCGLGFAGYVRATALDGDAGPRAQRRPPADHRSLRQLLGQIGYVGNNLNQIARLMNAGRDPRIPELEEAVHAYLEIRNAIFEALGKSETSGR